METNCYEIKTIEDIINLYKEFGSNDYIGEKITQIEHSVQAALLAQEKGDKSFAVGALLHDIGHLIGMKYNLSAMESCGTLGHENIGAEILRKIGFNEVVCSIVRNHVNAKRYLISDSSYLETLSSASKITFKYQGGIMSDEEISNFESDKLKDTYIEMRYIDDKAKVENMTLPSFESFEGLMKECLIN